MVVRIVMLASAVCVGGLAGCDKLGGTKAHADAAAPAATAAAAPAAKPMGGVGVVDLDAVARQLGRDVEMNTAVKERLTSLNEELKAMGESLDRLYEDRRAKYGDEPDEAEQKQLAAMKARMISQVADTKRRGENELVALKQEQIDRFREQTKPILREVAASRGLSIVIPKNNGLLLTVDPAVEITNEVAEKMVASQSPAAKPTEKPKRAKREAATETSAR